MTVLLTLLGSVWLVADFIVPLLPADTSAAFFRRANAAGAMLDAAAKETRRSLVGLFRLAICLAGIATMLAAFACWVPDPFVAEGRRMASLSSQRFRKFPEHGVGRRRRPFPEISRGLDWKASCGLGAGQEAAPARGRADLSLPLRPAVATRSHKGRVS